MDKSNISDISFAHSSVMLAEMLKYLNPVAGGSYLDCTFGAGGYSKAILDSCLCNLIAIDQDPYVVAQAKNFKEIYADRFNFINNNFSNAINILDRSFDGIVMDLGISSMQVDQSQRGFSFMHDGPLDMRMSSKGLSATEFINECTEKELADTIFKYGEENAARRIARKIVEERAKEPINSTSRLANIVRSCTRSGGKIDKATKTFQAIRIYINDELRALENFLKQTKGLLKADARIIVVSFHSLEDTIIKEFFRSHSAAKVARSKYSKKPVIEQDNKYLQVITKKPVTPTREEVVRNYRSRSAKMRVAARVGIL